MKSRSCFNLKTCILLVSIFLAATAYNIDKPYHIDDTAHLEIAHWIAHHPLSPMTGSVNWALSPKPIHTMNQPPLYFYMLALVVRLFGTGEVATHLFQASFVLLATIFFHKLARLKVGNGSTLLTAFLVLGPAFFVGQNLMVDVPLLSLWILFYYVLMTPTLRSDVWRFLAAGLIVSAAVLIKYTSLTLIPALILSIWLRNRKLLPLAFVPILALALWSLSNYLEYGSIHILDRTHSGDGNFLVAHLALKRLLAWLFCVGAVSPFSLAFASGWLRRKDTLSRMVAKGVILSVLVFCLALPPLFFAGLISEKVSDFILKLCFGLTGAWTVYAAVAASIGALRRNSPGMGGHDDALLLYWLISAAAFPIMLAPFMATRHALLAIPPLLVLGGHYLSTAKASHIQLALGLTLSLSLALGVSDWLFADLYRKQADVFKAELPGKVWYSGHWGWQWYAGQNGMEQLDSTNPNLKPGDWLVHPMSIDQHIDQQSLKDMKLHLVREFSPKSSPWHWFSTAGPARFYYSSSSKAPWNLSREPLGTFYIYRMEGDAAGEDRSSPF